MAHSALSVLVSMQGCCQQQYIAAFQQNIKACNTSSQLPTKDDSGNSLQQDGRQRSGHSFKLTAAALSALCRHPRPLLGIASRQLLQTHSHHELVTPHTHT